MRKTPLYEVHCKAGAKIIDFNGWALPVQYTGIIDEHVSVRNDAGLFDVSHMGEIAVEGAGSTRFIQNLITNDIGSAKDGQVVYSPVCYPDGGVVDDLLIYKFDNEKYLLVVNAANTGKDYRWLQDDRLHGNQVCGNQLKGDINKSRQSVTITDISDKFAQLALQGPEAEAILQKLTDAVLRDIRFYHFKDNIRIGGIKTLVSRTGYTGEDGFEIYVSTEDAVMLWGKIMDAGKNEGLAPVGLGARDTLRFEACLPLYGNEISADISPLEAGLGRFVRLDKCCFTGKEALAFQKEHGVSRKLIGFEMIDRGIPRSHYEIRGSGENIGFVTSGSFSPSLKKSLGLALVNIKHSIPGTEFDIMIRNNALKAKVTDIPFYSKRYKTGIQIKRNNK